MAFEHIIKYYEANQRLDRFLMQQAFTTKAGLMSRAECTDTIQKGLVLVNGVTTKPSYVLKNGDNITFIKQPTLKNTALLPNSDLPVEILFENEHFGVINKPAGIAMHPNNLKGTETVANWLIAHYPDIVTIGEDALRPGIVHRLDKHTSGICLFAKTEASFVALKDLFKQRAIQKTYLGIVHGHMTPQEGIIDTPIAQSLTLNKQAVIDKDLAVRGRIRTSVTEYKVVESFDSFDCVEAKPKTGRKHQIRVHFFSVGHPIVGDTTYNTKLTRKIDRDMTPPPTRHFLHAKRLQFNLFGTDYDFSSPLPQEFENFIKTLTKKGVLKNS